MTIIGKLYLPLWGYSREKLPPTHLNHPFVSLNAPKRKVKHCRVRESQVKQCTQLLMNAGMQGQLKSQGHVLYSFRPTTLLRQLQVPIRSTDHKSTGLWFRNLILAVHLWASLCVTSLGLDFNQKQMMSLTRHYL